MKELVTEIKKEDCGWFLFDRLHQWVAYSMYGKAGYGLTKKECIANARKNGYVVPNYVINKSLQKIKNKV